MADFFNLMIDFWKQVLGMIAFGLCLGLAKSWGGEYGEIAFWLLFVIALVGSVVYSRAKSKAQKEN